MEQPRPGVWQSAVLAPTVSESPGGLFKCSFLAPVPDLLHQNFWEWGSRICIFNQFFSWFWCLKKKMYCFEVMWVGRSKQVPSTSSPHLQATLESGVWKAARYVTASPAPSKVARILWPAKPQAAVRHMISRTICYLSRQILAGENWWLNSQAPVTKCDPCANPARVDGNPAPLETVQMAGTRETHQDAGDW